MRDLAKDLRRGMARPWQPFVECPQEMIDRHNRPAGMTRCFTNNRYVVMVYDNTPFTRGDSFGFCTRVLIQRLDDSVERNWEDLQRVKREIFGDVWALEYYPTDAETINDHNIYWLHIFSECDIPIPTTSRRSI